LSISILVVSSTSQFSFPKLSILIHFGTWKRVTYGIYPHSVVASYNYTVCCFFNNTSFGIVVGVLITFDIITYKNTLYYNLVFLFVVFNSSLFMLDTTYAWCRVYFVCTRELRVIRTLYPLILRLN